MHTIGLFLLLSFRLAAPWPPLEEPSADRVATLLNRSLRYREERSQVRDELASEKTPFDVFLRVLTCDRVELRRVAAEALSRRTEASAGASILKILTSEQDGTTAFKLAIALAERQDVTPADFRQALAEAK